MTSDIIIDLFFWHQLLQFGSALLTPFVAVSIALTAVLWIISIAWEDDEWVTYKKATLFKYAHIGSLITSIVIILFATVIFFRDVWLKTEIAKVVVPNSLDIMDSVSREVKEMWNILKGLLR